ncbi:hypothetical protein BH11PLA2_BH11PLA2_51060 [soil metagenome]
MDFRVLREGFTEQLSVDFEGWHLVRVTKMRRANVAVGNSANY